MNLRVKLDDQPPGLRTVSIFETRETWRLFVKQLHGGTVILGVSFPEDITNIDRRLEENVNRFGSSLNEALKVEGRAIDRNLEYAVVDESGRIRSATGEIPLKVVQNQTVRFNKVDEIRDENGVMYGTFSQMFRDSLRTGGIISVFEKLEPHPWFVMRHWIINCLTSGFVAFVGTLIGIPYIGEKFDPHRLLRDALREGESARVEFKESLRWDQWHGVQQPPEESKKKLAEGIAVKTMAAFLNNRGGGTLFIGIADDRRIVGLDRDYESLVKAGEPRGDREKDQDRFQLHFRNLLAARIDRDVSNLYIETSIIEENGKDVCVVHARPAAMPVYIPDGKAKAFYVRDGASTVALDVEQVVGYVEERWPKSLWRRGWNLLRRS
jgi:hypothetical protein